MAQLQTEAERKFYESQTKLADEQRDFIKSQKEFIELQKKELAEGNKDRKSMNHLTFVLAFGVVTSIFFNLYQITMQSQEADNSHLLIISALFIFLFIFFVSFISHIFPMREQMTTYLKDNWLFFVCIFMILLFLFLILVIFPSISLVISFVSASAFYFFKL